MIGSVQRGLEKLYRIDAGACVSQFLLDEHQRDSLELHRRPKEQLLVRQEGEELDVGLFLHPKLQESLFHWAAHRTLPNPLEHFLWAIEGVSHFVLLSWCAARQRAVSQLEFELQAEIDKFVTLALLCELDPQQTKQLWQRIFFQFSLLDGLEDEESVRYQTASLLAQRYSASLIERFVTQGRTLDLLQELRTFYRLPFHRKVALGRR